MASSSVNDATETEVGCRWTTEVFGVFSFHWHRKRITYSLLQKKDLTEIWGSADQEKLGELKLRTMNVAAFAISDPHVSAIISSVNAFVPTSIPLLTKISIGRLSRSSDGRSVLRIPLQIFLSAHVTLS